MKKILTVLLAAVLLLSFTACGSKSSAGTTGVMTLKGDPMPEVAEVVENDGFIQEFDKNGNILRSTSFGADGSVRSVFEMVYKKGVQIGSIVTTYDETGAVTTITENIFQQDSTLSYTYDADRVLLNYSELTFISGGSGTRTIYYDAKGVITGSDEWVTDGNGGSINYIYDANGELLGTMQYDSSGNLVNSLEANAEWLDDNTKKVFYDWGYDIEHYNDNKELVQIDNYHDDELQSVSYYHPGGNVYKRESYWDGALDYAYEYEYIEVGGESLVSRMTNIDGDDGDRHVTSYEYDAKGNIIKLQYEDSDPSYSYTETYQYDSKGNITVTAKEAANPDDSYTETRQYDSKGNVTVIAKEAENPDYSSTTTYTYNSKGLVTAIRSEGRLGCDETTKEYDSEGRLLKTEDVYYDGSTLVCEYHSNGQLKTEEYIGDKYYYVSYDENGVKLEEATRHGFTGYDYSRFENGLEVEYIYESPDGSYKYRAEYEYYADGRMKSKVEYENGVLKSETEYD